MAKDMAKIFKSGARVVIYCVPERVAMFNRQGVIDEQMPMRDWVKITAAAANAGGVRYFALWAYRGCESLSSLWPNGKRKQCAEVWRAACEIFSSNFERSDLSWL
ncbi:MAG: hypothetical protein NVSMB39_0260 [Candidatus Saccharimonadales bacterium]